MRSVVLSLGLAVLGVFSATGVRADDLHLAQHTLMPARSHANCFCRAQGRMFAYGESVCLKTPDGPRLAQCAMELNVTSWTITENRCPES